ncbi:MAG TPA: hypothetical protein VMA71_00190 [Alloacidobacterium sp.]|nr:hypothetical protein [Alloacidobacterium sp.]
MSLPVTEIRFKAKRSVFILSTFLAVACIAAHAQYPGRINKNADTAPTLRATGIFEWTGDLTKPKAGRLIPLSVWDGEQYQPGGLYLAQPAPLTVLTGTIYELEQAGTPKGLFSVNGAENLGGSWIAIGSVKPELAKARARRPPMSKHPPQVVKDVNSDSDRPTLHRKGSSDSSSGSTTTSGSQTGSGSGSSTTASNSDGPTLHRRDSSDSSSGSSGDSTDAQNAPSVDPDRPTLHRRDSSDSSGGGGQNAPAPDPDRPILHESTETASSESGAPVTATANTDPDRPKLRYGKPETQEGIVEPSKLEGLPVDMNQMAAISDVKTSEPHPYTYSWADPGDAAKMKAAMEELAQKTIAGISTTQATMQTTVTKPVTKTSAARRKAARPSPPPLPLLDDEKFNAYELSYSGGATLVFSAKTAGVGDAVKYVTLIAQPDFYGMPQVLFKQVTSDERLDIIPRMRLVDAVDTDGDGRAELIFELRGKTSREFAIYRVVNRHVEQAFNTGPLP